MYICKTNLVQCFTGAGFAGFWYHLGLFHKLFDDINNDSSNNASSIFNSDTSFHCYSSGCLSLLLSFLPLVRNRQSSHYRFVNATKTENSTFKINSIVDDVYYSALNSQKLWVDGTINQYEIVDDFLKSTIVDPIEAGYINENELIKFLPRLNILVTTAKTGAESVQAKSISDLLDLLRMTTWIPFVTGNGIGQKNVRNQNYQKNIMQQQQQQIDNENENDDWFLDGGFSRVLHPKCQYTVSVPINWQTTIHTLNPGMTQMDVNEMWQMGIEDSIRIRRD
jgi:hypothetical protein